jgi:hypothetical protein
LFQNLKLIAWQSEGGDYTSGTVKFAVVGPNRTRIDLRLIYDPEGFVEIGGRLPRVPVKSKQISNGLKNSSRIAVRKWEHGAEPFGNNVFARRGKAAMNRAI